ncbi:MAG: class II fructose-bisphosphate aldolase [Candidatus Omnitrophica bacterium]|nr:class II fructose-bisphosphate aldolase [Candidatus Omnitrophota bacterium]
MMYKIENEIFSDEIIVQEQGDVVVKNEKLFREKIVPNLIETIIMSDSSLMKKTCCWVTHQAAQQLGVVPSSIQGLYEARGRGEISGFTVPAMNLRVLTYDIARGVFRAAAKINAGAFIFEIAKSEIGYTDQRPWEYTSAILLAAMREGYRGPVFLQGDHFQVKATNYLKDKEKEVNPLKDLIREAVEGGFYNIDIDSSTLVDLEKATIDEQQKSNYEVCALFTKFIRDIQPRGIEVSVGGEIGEVGGKNSTAEELNAFMEGYKRSVGAVKGISKMSIQTGTTHGGVVLPDGSIAKVSIDFDTLKELSEIGRTQYQLSGCVQHGASTLPNEAFHKFPETGCSEIHLATQFQNIVYEHLPIPLKEKIYAWLHENCASEKKPDQTDDQFIYKTRKKALGPFKKEIFSLTQDLKMKISKALEAEFDFLFSQLKINDTKVMVDTYIPLVSIARKKEELLKEEQELGELEGAD